MHRSHLKGSFESDVTSRMLANIIVRAFTEKRG